MFQVGDKVRCTRKQIAKGEWMDIGYEGVVTHVNGWAIAVDNRLGYGEDVVMSQEAFVLVERGKQKKAKRIKLPCYAVVKGGKVVYTTADREDARATKAAFGGKAAGTAIYKMVVDKEIR